MVSSEGLANSNSTLCTFRGRGCKYFVTFIDDKSLLCVVSLPQIEKFKEFEAWGRIHTGQNTKILRSDNGGEYVSKEFDAFLAQKGIQRQLRAPYTPEQNAVAERMKRTLVESARSMLHHAGLDNWLW